MLGLAMDCPLLISRLDRAKDAIKSGGEWIGTLELEAAATSHHAVAQAAAIGIPHPRWQEQPRLLCTLKPGETVTADALLSHLESLVVRWWLPDDIVFVDAMPMTHGGKINRVELRRLYGTRETASMEGM